MPFEEAREKVVRLLERFEENYDSRMNGHYNEAQVRQEFINPFFEALGWDIYNKSGHAEQYKDVVHEEYISFGQYGKAPDYSFRIGGQTKFFVEAKKPSINIKTEPAPAYQLRLYAWNRKLPFSLLTNFREFAVYECRKKPSPKDSASTERVFYTTFRDYPEKFREIYDKFSKHAVLHGDFDRYAESKKGKRGTSEVDAEFLKDIEGWRLLLAKDLAKRNPALEIHGLNFAVQQTIDRIIFLRIAEDRGVEKYGQLEALLNGANAYRRLLSLYDEADKKYNSGLFNFSDDKLSHRLDVDDKVLREIISSLYYPKSQYLFNVISADILGNVYEQFLGKVIRLTPGHLVKVEDKPEVKKAGGVYYTPQFVVDYIVKNTVGRWLEGKKPRQAEALTVLDPACGSGTFLLGAYQYLIDWHLKYYLEDGPEKWTKGKNTTIFQTARGEWRLTTKEKKRILLNSIYGVDIDRQAVEGTKLSLLLKVLEGENEETLKSLNLFGERALPSLEGNIKCGNSLIGPDFYADRNATLFGNDEEYRINAFDWKREFKDIIKNGGFECVIGNPPYIRIQTLNEFIPESAEYFKQKYTAASKGNYDIYVTMVEKGLSLLSGTGRLGFILPHKFYQAQYGEPLRELISKGKHLAHAVHFGDQQVFTGATTYTNLMFLDKCGRDICRFIKVHDLNTWKNDGIAEEGEIPFSEVNAEEWNFVIGADSKLFNRLKKVSLKLGEIANIFVGLQTSADTVFLFKNSSIPSGKIAKVFSKELNGEIEIESDILKPVVRSGEIGHYFAHPNATVLFPYSINDGKAKLFSEIEMDNNYPLAWNYLKANKKLLSNREHGKFKSNGWYQLYPKNLNLWEQEKILIPYMITNLSAHFDRNNLFFVNVTTGGFGITIKEGKATLKYLTALLNSKLLDWFLKKVSTNFHGGYFAANKQFLVQLPIRPIDFKNKGDVKMHDRMVELVTRMLDLNKKLAANSTPADKEFCKRQIDATDAEIDALVYKLYDLTDEEIKLVEAKN